MGRSQARLVAGLQSVLRRHRLFTPEVLSPVSESPGGGPGPPCLCFVTFQNRSAGPLNAPQWEPSRKPAIKQILLGVIEND